MAARKIDPTSDEAAWAWVASAASTDEDTPVLTCVAVSQAGRVLAATDRHRLHIAVLDTPIPLPDGIYDAVTRWPVEGNYPNWRDVLDKALDRQLAEYVTSQDGCLRAISEGLGKAVKKTGGLGGMVSVPSPNEPVAFNPRFLFDAMLAIEPSYAGVYAADKWQPLVVADSHFKRIAVIMPIREYGVIPPYSIDSMLTPTSGQRAELPQLLSEREPLAVVPEKAHATV